MKASGAGYVAKSSRGKVPVAIPEDTYQAQESEAQEGSQTHSQCHAVKSSDSDLDVIRKDLGDCKRCRLGKTRTTLVFGIGNPDADLVFVGEAPGFDEDRQGEPFVGKAGQLLTKIIEAIDLKREDVYICNVIKCRPPENRNPLPEEIEQCEPFLVRQIEAIKPKVICALGKFAAQTLLKSEAPISTLRGSFQDYHGVPLMPTYHPAFLLRNPKMKRPVWEDIQMVKNLLKGENL